MCMCSKKWYLASLIGSLEPQRKMMKFTCCKKVRKSSNVAVSTDNVQISKDTCGHRLLPNTVSFLAFVGQLIYASLFILALSYLQAKYFSWCSNTVSKQLRQTTVLSIVSYQESAYRISSAHYFCDNRYAKNMHSHKFVHYYILYSYPPRINSRKLNPSSSLHWSTISCK